ncbi:hypothetical protein JYK14_18055 [Siccirubricoccus sp. KC 17139]|uniref:Uncharacterized protein n=1 Tax=Siccirubricoccus soli TaxID=2899147 RepID=A0ABT1DAP8_9PROT|nr:hypothetical protein [Siccirubricoccus soli]MCO6418050.1 hypothetical protein [Siccirubricoccus soli]MCP2684185.1 hypothetical protein [Siccirubricoccus soli]
MRGGLDPFQGLGLQCEGAEAFFIARGVHAFYGFDRAAYWAACEAELKAYPRDCLGREWKTRDIAAFAQLLAHFEICRSNGMN